MAFPTLASRSELKVQKCCAHCGTVLPPGLGNERFCSPGCRVVHERIVASNLQDYYIFAQRRAEPVSPRVFHPQDNPELRKFVATLQATRQTSAAFTIEGVSCLGCVWLIEELFSRQPGSVACRVSPATGRAHLTWRDGGCDLVEFSERLQDFGYLLLPFQPGRTTHTGSPQTSLARRMGLCAAFAMNAMLFTLPVYLGMDPHDRLATAMLPVTLACATGALAVGGSYFAARAWQALRMGRIHIDLPITLGIVVAYLGSIAAVVLGNPLHAYFDFVCIFTFLMLTGRWTQNHAAARARARLQTRAFEPGPLSDEHGVPTDAEHLQKGAVYHLHPGGTVPTRSILKTSRAEFRLDWIDGEPEPRLFESGSLIPSGAGFIGDTPIQLESCESWPQSLLYQLTSARPGSQGRLHTSAERWIRRYLVAVILLGISGASLWFALGQPVTALHVFVSVLVVSCPCAIGVALPLADELAASALRTYGVHLNDQSLWSRLKAIRFVAFDKTGTLTRGQLQLEDAAVLKWLSPRQETVLRTMSARSLHPVARCLREALASPDAPPLEPGKVEELPGFGLQLAARDGTWRLGRADWAANTDSEETVFAHEGKILCRMRFSERLHDDAVSAVTSLRNAGYRVVLLSGDRSKRVGVVANALGLQTNEVHSGMTPQEKAEWVRNQPPDSVLMIGDGGNDSLAFAAAACRGAPTTDHGLLEKRADFFLAGNRLGGIPALFETAFRRWRVTRRLLAFTLSYNAVAVGLSLAGHMNPLLAAILMPLSSLVALGIVTATFSGKDRTRQSSNTDPVTRAT